MSRVKTFKREPGKKYRVRNLRIGKIDAVDFPAQRPEGRALIIKRADPEVMDEDLFKRAQMTTAVNGHAHLVGYQYFREDQYSEEQAGETTYAKDPDDDTNHSHPWIRALDGSITIGEADGHTHEVLDQWVTVSADDPSFRKKAPTKSEKVGGQSVEFAAGDYAHVPDPEKPSAWKLRLTNEPGGDPDPTIVGAAVAALSPDGYRGNQVEIPSDDLPGVISRVRTAWTQANQDRDPDEMPAVLKKSDEDGGDDMDKLKELEKKLKDQEEQSATLTKRAELAESLAKFSDAERTHYNTLDDDGKAGFLKSDADVRKKVIAKAQETDESIELYGRTIRKSAVGEDAFEIMKAQAKEAAENRDELRKARERAELQDLEKRAAQDIPKFPGDTKIHAALLKAVDGIEDEETRKAAHGALKAGNDALEKAFHAFGKGKIEGATDAEAKIEKLAKAYAEEHKIDIDKAKEAVLQTPEGSKLYEEYEAARTGG